MDNYNKVLHLVLNLNKAFLAYLYNITLNQEFWITYK